MKDLCEYEIRNEKGELFCKCRRDSAGNIRMLVKGTSISLQELQEKALNPTSVKTYRAKKSAAMRMNGP